jgi:hypothetical protein
MSVEEEIAKLAAYANYNQLFEPVNATWRTPLVASIGPVTACNNHHTTFTIL